MTPACLESAEGEHSELRNVRHPQSNPVVGGKPTVDQPCGDPVGLGNHVPVGHGGSGRAIDQGGPISMVVGRRLDETVKVASRSRWAVGRLPRSCSLPPSHCFTRVKYSTP